ncbi:NADPH-dependent FMN reductase [Parasphingorhabdus sp.]|uniref:NADPH-dependent FMN reductase n=1 Tax=Parasphingorhabdus sp. TaxID=2709688 RepID=UPI003A92F85D
MEKVQILLLAGGIRNGSLNEKLIGCAAGVVNELGLGATRLSLSDYRLPLYGVEDLRIDDVPEALALKSMFMRHDAVIVASPEHNGSVTAMLKNAIDWLSCPGPGEAPQAYSAFRRKAFGMLSASSSPFGGLRGLSQLRQILTMVNAWVVPEQLSIPHAHRAFDADGELVDPKLRDLLVQIGQSVAAAAGP